MNAAIRRLHGINELSGDREVVENKVLIQVGQLLVASLVLQLRLSLHSKAWSTRATTATCRSGRGGDVTVLCSWLRLSRLRPDHELAGRH